MPSKSATGKSLSRPSSLALRASVVALASVVGLSLVGHAQSPVGVQEPAWSPDGKRIAVSYLDRLWTMTPDGKQARAVFQDLKPSSPQALVIEREPAWSPDGSRIAFAADKGEGFDVFVVGIRNGVAGGQPVAVTTMAGDERWPSWTADGRLVFAHRDARPSGRNGDPSLQYDLYLSSPVSGSEAWQSPLALTETADSETYPRVSPDGSKVAFISGAGTGRASKRGNTRSPSGAITYE